jgi:hypothetical protein
VILDPYSAPPATLCDPHRTRDLDPAWSCRVPGCDCGSTPSRVEFEQELAVELRHRYDLLALEREAEELAREAKALRDPWWLRALRWLSRRIASGHGA